MDWINKNYDKALLIAASVVALAFSGLFVMKSLSFATNFSDISSEEKRIMEDPGIPEVEGWSNKLATKTEWQRLNYNDYKVPITVSVPILEKPDGQIVTMPDPKSVPLRVASHPREDSEVEVPNNWLVKHFLDYTNSAVLEQDPDGDGFNNLEEYVGGTDPNDAEDHAPFITQLYLKNRGEDTYILKFSAAIDPQYQIARNEPEPRKSWFKAIGEKFPDRGADQGRFEVIGYNRVVDPNSGADRSELTIKDSVRLDNNPFILTRSEEVDRPIYWANFEYRHKNSAPEAFRVDLAGEFSIETEPSVVYTLKSISEDHAIISYSAEDGTSKEIRIPNK